MSLPLPEIRTIRDFYAFEEHVRTCRRQRGLEMVRQWYEIPVFYFSNPHSVIRDGDPVIPPALTSELDFELEIAAVVGCEATDLPPDDSALDCLLGFTIYNDWSARDLQRNEMAVGLGPAKGKDFANSLGPSVTPLADLRDCWQDGRLHLQHGPIDLVIEGWGAAAEVAAAWDRSGRGTVAVCGTSSSRLISPKIAPTSRTRVMDCPSFVTSTVPLIRK